MLQLSGMLLNRPVLSLRIGRTIATTSAAIINPDNLKIEGLYCQHQQNRRQLILLSQDIRDILPQGIVVNDEDVLSDPKDLVRLERTLALHFNVLGMPVETSSKHKVGKVNDFAVEVETMYIQKLYVSRSLFKSFSQGSLGIDRSQIVEITKSKIVINDLEQKVPVGARAVA